MRWTHTFMYGRAVAKDRAYDGRFYTAVTTTGIYCLPSCPARKPKSEHVTFFAAETEAKSAGFRACLRCRPDRFGEDGDLQLLEGLLARVQNRPGAFRCLADLVVESGVGATKLAALFRDHLHTTPAGCLQRVKLRAAQRLLLGTELPASEIALEAGFESISVFHAQFQKQAAMTPGKYRELARTDAFRLRLPADFRAADVLAYHGRDPQSLCERVEGSTLFKAFRRQVLEVHFAGREARCRVHGETEGSSMREFHHGALRMLGLLQDPAPFERAVVKDPAFRALTAVRPGLRIPLTAEVWEAVVWAILGQQVNLAFAYTLRRNLVERCGDAGPLGLRCHPGPGAVAGLSPEALAELKLSRAKAECLLRVARAAQAGDLDLESLSDGAASRASARLLAIKGIGPWTAQYVLMRGCGFGDCVPIGDAGLSLALQRHLGLDHRPGPGETAALLAPFAPHRSLAVFHLWASLKGTPT